MILVDTNVWSELLRATPDDRVRHWEAVNAPRLWLSTVVIGELLSGTELMPPGQRQQSLRDCYRQMLIDHSDRIADFDLKSARRYAEVLAHQVRAGRNPGTADTQIAATALANEMALATRNLRHFEGLGLKLIDPWTE